MLSGFQDNEANMLRMEEERQVIQDSLQKSADEVTQQLAQTTAKNTDLEKVKQVQFVESVSELLLTCENGNHTEGCTQCVVKFSCVVCKADGQTWIITCSV